MKNNLMLFYIALIVIFIMASSILLIKYKVSESGSREQKIYKYLIIILFINIIIITQTALITASLLVILN